MSDHQLTVADYLRNRPGSSVALYRQVESALLEMGGVGTSVSQTTVTFKGSRRGFAGARPSTVGVEGYFDMMRGLQKEDHRIRTVVLYQRNLFVHHYRLTDPSDCDETFLGWLKEAHAVGHGAHLSKKGVMRL